MKARTFARWALRAAVIVALGAGFAHVMHADVTDDGAIWSAPSHSVTVR